MTKLQQLALLVLSTLAVIAFVGCATIYTPPGATTAQKMKDDLSAAGQIEADVKAQCGAQFAPVGALAMSILSVAEVAGDIAAYNIGGAIAAAVTALPALIADAKALACVGKVIAADYAKLKPKAAPPAAAAPAPTPVPAPPAKVSRAEAVGELVMSLLEQAATVTIEGSPDAPVVSAATP